MSGNPLTRAIVGALAGFRQDIATKQMEHGVDFIETMARGIRHFRRDVFPQRREQFESLAEAQQPKALFLTCADSRIVPSMITQTGPGELFVERNPGNIAPVYSGEAVGVSASIERGSRRRAAALGSISMRRRSIARSSMCCLTS